MLLKMVRSLIDNWLIICTCDGISLSAMAAKLWMVHFHSLIIQYHSFQTIMRPA